VSVYLEKTELKDTYAEAERVAVDWFKPFDEYERLAGNKLSKSLGKNMPRVNDGSLAASLLETPMNVLPSMQPGKFTSTSRKDAWLNELANIIWKTKVVPNANTQANFFDKEQIALYRALKYGAQPRYNFFVSTDTYTGSDWSLPYIRNVKLEPGKFSVEDCDYVFLDIYYTKIQLKKIIEDQKSEAKSAKAEGRKADSSWDTDNLQKLADMAMTSKQMEEQNINERDKQVFSSGIKVTACFNRGVDAPFYMFSKHLEAKDILREWKNPDPTGDLPITMQYCYENLESPYGIGRVELAGPTQNVLDYMTQAHVLATQLGLQPPVKVAGAVDAANLNSFVHTPNAMWLTGQTTVDLLDNTSKVYSQFPANFGLYKSQLQTLQGRTDGSVSATSGNPSFSKTSAGVAQQQERTNSQDNYLRNKADTASAKMAQKMMNVHMAQMQGADILDIAEEDRDRLEKSGYFDDNPQTVEPSLNEIPILYDELHETFKFEYDARPEADDEEKNRWLELIDIATSNPNVLPAVQASGYEFNIGEAFKKVISASGADGWDKVLVKMDPEQQGGKIDPATGQPVQPQIDPATGQPLPPQQPDPAAMQGQQAMQQSNDMHQLNMQSKQQDMAMKLDKHQSSMQPQEAPQEQAQDFGPEQANEGQEDNAPEIQGAMDMYGIDQNMAMAVVEARRQGFNEDEIIAYLKQELGANQWTIQ